jgi:hypothetical protein
MSALFGACGPAKELLEKTAIDATNRPASQIF